MLFHQRVLRRPLVEDLNMLVLIGRGRRQRRVTTAPVVSVGTRLQKLRHTAVRVEAALGKGHMSGPSNSSHTRTPLDTSGGRPAPGRSHSKSSRKVSHVTEGHPPASNRVDSFQPSPEPQPEPEPDSTCGCRSTVTLVHMLQEDGHVHSQQWQQLHLLPFDLTLLFPCLRPLSSLE